MVTVLLHCVKPRIAAVNQSRTFRYRLYEKNWLRAQLESKTTALSVTSTKRFLSNIRLCVQQPFVPQDFLSMLASSRITAKHGRMVLRRYENCAMAKLRRVFAIL